MADPTTPIPLPEALNTWMIHPDALPIMMKFRDDICDLGLAFIKAGATAEMVVSGLEAVVTLIRTNEIDWVNALPVDYPEPPYAVVAAPGNAPYTPAPSPAAPTPAPVAPTPAPEPPAPVPAAPAPGPVTPGPDWVDANGMTYANWQASVTAAQTVAANLGVPYTPVSVPVFSPPTPTAG